MSSGNRLAIWWGPTLGARPGGMGKEPPGALGASKPRGYLLEHEARQAASSRWPVCTACGSFSSHAGLPSITMPAAHPGNQTFDRDTHCPNLWTHTPGPGKSPSIVRNMVAQCPETDNACPDPILPEDLWPRLPPFPSQLGSQTESAWT